MVRSSRTTQLIDDLLHFSRCSREPLHCLRVPLRELVLQVVARLKERLDERQVTVHVGEIPDCCGDRALLEQVLVNVLPNAFKFTFGRDMARVEIGALRSRARASACPSCKGSLRGTAATYGPIAAPAKGQPSISACRHGPSRARPERDRPWQPVT